MSPKDSYRNFVFTINNPTGPLAWWGNVRYAVYQKEVGESGTPHFQGYVQLKDSEKLRTLKNRPGFERAHFEPRRGTHDQARDYAMKQDTRVEGPWEHGEENKTYKGKRTDLLTVKKRIDNREKLIDIMKDEECFEACLRYRNGFTQYAMETAEKRSWKTKVYVFIGPTGIGKTKWANENMPGAYWKEMNKWWDGYDGTSDIIIDEFKGWLPHCQLLRLLDRYECSVEVKGASINFAPKRIAILSNTPVEEWYHYDTLGEQSLPALKRRIDVYVTDPNQRIVETE